MKNDFHHTKTRHSSNTDAELDKIVDDIDRDINSGQFKKLSANKRFKRWIRNLLPWGKIVNRLVILVLAGALVTIGYFHWENKVETAGFERGRIVGAQEQRHRAEQDKKLVEQALEQLTAESTTVKK